jgi:hypothetical protein
MSNEDYEAKLDEANAALLENELKGIAKADLNAATIRTAVPMAWTAVVVWLIDRFGIKLSMDDLTTLAPVFAVVGGIVYRLARILEARFPRVAFVFLGSTRTPMFYSNKR